MEWFEALVLGIIQGLTEFLPVSSSGHLQIFSALFGLEGEENLTFAVAVHAATVCSTIVILWCPCCSRAFSRSSIMMRWPTC